MTHNVTKLPKWAQEHIADLERQIDTLQIQYSEIKQGSESRCSGEVYRSEAGSMDEFILPEQSVYYFQVGKSKFNRISVYKSNEDEDVIVINCDSGCMDIEPRACNSIHLRKRK